ncbi:OPT oligopeptide transporter protein-domain-containing protein [Obelidium mucronatum]|nr:OPT oligopeptide transporter protein-domain-containing protein [Obelidium mucronatum]
MQSQQQYFDRSRRPRGASAHAARAMQGATNLDNNNRNPYLVDSFDNYPTTPSSMHTQEPAMQAGFNAYSVPVSPASATGGPYSSNRHNSPSQFQQQSQQQQQQQQRFNNPTIYSQNSYSSQPQHQQPQQQQQQYQNNNINGSIVSVSKKDLRHPVNATGGGGGKGYYNVSEPIRQDSDSHIELVDRKKTQYAHDEEEEGDADDEYLDEIYQIIDAVVPRTDDSTLPALTFRVWVLGLGFGVFLAAANTILSFRSNALSFNSFITVLLAYPLGLFMAKVLPEGILNPGPFNYKEHALIFVMTNAMATSPYGLSNIIGQRYQLYQDLGLISCFAFAITTQCFGYGFAGITRRFLVRPAAMLWPSNFATIAMLNSLHSTEDVSRGRYPMSRFEFFWLAASAMFFYTFLPQYVAPMLGALSVICWFTKVNVNATDKAGKIAMVLGSSSPGAGLGFLSFSLDWSLFSIYAPITTPLWAMFNQMFGIYFFVWIVVPICWYFDVFGDQKVGNKSLYGFAMNTPATFNKDGNRIRTANFVMYDPKDNSMVLNTTFYEENKPIHITTFFAVQYLTCFIVFVSAMVHVGLWYGKDIWNRFKASLRDLDSDDIHARLMDAYPDVPEWWYMGLLIVTLVGGIAVCQFGGFDLPWWGVLIAIILALVSMIPIGIIQAISGQQIGLNVMSEFLIGLILPGRIAAVMAFKTFSYMAMYQGLYLVQDLKLGHYIKVPPKAMFISQLAATLVGAIVSTATAIFFYESFGKIDRPNDPRFPHGFQWALQNQPPNSGWNSAFYDTFLSAGAIWGAIGPARFFGPGSPYFTTLFGFLAGILLPVVPWIMHKLQPDSFWHLINVPLIVVMPTGLGSQQSTYLTPMIVAVVVNYYVKKYRHTWWKKYAYVMSSALDSGSALAVLMLFYLTRFNQQHTLPFPAWFMNTGDMERCLPSDVLTCMERATMGAGFGYGYDVSKDTDFCQDING